MHVNMALGADDADGHFKKSCRAHQHTTGRVLDVAGTAQGNFKTERNGVGVSQLNLVKIAARAEDAQIRDHAAARSDERDRLLRGELAIHVEPLVNGEFRALAEKRFHRVLREMAVTCADVDDKRTRRGSHARQRLAKLGVNRLSNHVFNDGMMWCWSSNRHKV